MSSGTVIPETIDKLIEIVGAALPDVQVVDGMGKSQRRRDKSTIVYVGVADPDAEGLALAGSSEQEWAWLGHSTRNAEFVIRCAIDAWNGNGNQKEARDTAAAALDEFADAITSDPTLEGVVLQVRGVADVVLEQKQDNNGAHARMSFGLPCQAWLT